MKKIEAIIRPTAFFSVKKALQAIDVNAITIAKTETLGQQKGHCEFYRDVSVHVEAKASIKMEVVVEDVMVARVRDAIVAAVQSDGVCTGRILITHVDEVIDLTSGYLLTRNKRDTQSGSREQIRLHKIA